MNMAITQAYTREFIEAARKRVSEDLRRQGLSRFRSYGMPEWVREIVCQVSDRTGICVSAIAGDLRRHEISKARNEAIYLVKSRKPMLSSPQLGKWFNRDHTSILYSIASHQEANSLPKLVGYQAGKVRDRNNVRNAATRALAKLEAAK